MPKRLEKPMVTRPHQLLLMYLTRWDGSIIRRETHRYTLKNSNWVNELQFLNHRLKFKILWWPKPDEKMSIKVWTIRRKQPTIFSTSAFWWCSNARIFRLFWTFFVLLGSTNNFWGWSHPILHTQIPPTVSSHSPFITPSQFPAYLPLFTLL